MKHSVISLTINGAERQMLVAPGTTLVDVLRENQGLSGTRRGCDQGACGACTVLVDGKTMMSCLLPVETIDGATVETIEGLTPMEGLHPIQEAFLEGFATQCGFCTSGMIMATVGLLARNPEPTREDAVRAISGNICRCTGYAAIIDAVLDAAKRVREAEPAAKARVA
jgi:carbon-monoxide dehydrogenase small subunit